jgi:transcriptional regulator with XRE-family HTH domain
LALESLAYALDHPAMADSRLEAAQQLGSTLRRKRQAALLSQQALAGAADLHPSEISRLECAARDPRLSTVVRVAHALGISPSELLADVE